MESCFMCLKIIKEKMHSIMRNSAQWLELDIAMKIDKHFWSLNIKQSHSRICLSCWKEVEAFHRFYLIIEEVHMNYEKIMLIPESERKQELVTQISNIKHEVLELEKSNVEYWFLESEICLDQSVPDDWADPKADDETKIAYTTVDDSLKIRAKSFSFYDSQEGNDPLEKVDDETGGKRRYSNENHLELESTIDEQKIKVRKEINGYESDCATEKDDDHTNLANLTYTNSTKKDRNKAVKSCGKKRNSREENDKYIVEHFNQMKCNICQIPFENFSNIQKHFLEIHKQKGYIFCCNRKFFKRSDLVDHIHSHLNPNHFQCVRCKKVLSDRIRLEKHIMYIHASEKISKKHCCDVCGKTFFGFHDLNMHKLTHLSEEQKKFLCKECGKFYGSSYLLHRHMQAVHLKKFVKICYICGKSLSSSTELKIHMNKHEGMPKPTINCDICGLRVTTERGLKKHKDGQHPVDGKKDHHCPICPKVSPTLKALRKHINTMHEKGCDHKCTICQKAFKRAEVLREHMASHTGTPLYTCPWCPKTFNSNSNMYAHRKKMHPKEWKEVKLQKFSGNLITTMADNNNCFK